MCHDDIDDIYYLACISLVILSFMIVCVPLQSKEHSNIQFISFSSSLGGILIYASDLYAYFVIKKKKIEYKLHIRALIYN